MDTNPLNGNQLRTSPTREGFNHKSIWSNGRVSPFGVALGALTLGLATTVSIGLLLAAQLNRENEVLKTETKLGLEHDLESRISIYSESLAGLQGLFGATDNISRRQFADYTEAAATFGHFPGIQAVSFSPLVAREQVADFESAVRSDTSLDPGGYPDFTVRTEGDDDDLFVVDYLVPIEGNEGAFGFDLGSEPTRRVAIEAARDSGEIVATGPIVLVQEQAEQAAVILFAPSYDGPFDSLADRRNNFRGVFSAVLRMDDFLSGASSREDIRFTVFDVETSLASNDSTTGQLFGTWTDDFEDSTEHFEINAGARTWQVALDPSSIPTDETGKFFIFFGVLASAVPFVLATYFSYRERQRLITQAAELQVANDAIRASNADLERFAYVAAHDLRAPVRGVQNMVDLLDEELEETAPESNVQHLLTHMSQAASKMDAMVNGLLEFSTIGGRSKDTWTVVNIGAKFKEAISELREATGTEPLVRLGQLPDVRGNPVLIERLLANLIMNASKYRSDERPLELAIDHRELQNHIAFSVKDNGVGIADEFHDQVFEIFRRLHGQDEIEGRGIGLALCRKIVEYHDGEISLESVEGRGTTFTFTLPKAQPKEKYLG